MPEGKVRFLQDEVPVKLVGILTVPLLITTSVVLVGRPPHQFALLLQLLSAPNQVPEAKPVMLVLPVADWHPFVLVTVTENEFAPVETAWLLAVVPSFQR